MSRHRRGESTACPQRTALAAAAIAPRGRGERRGVTGARVAHRGGAVRHGCFRWGARRPAAAARTRAARCGEVVVGVWLRARRARTSGLGPIRSALASSGIRRLATDVGGRRGSGSLDDAHARRRRRRASDRARLFGPCLGASERESEREGGEGARRRDAERDPTRSGHAHGAARTYALRLRRPVCPCVVSVCVCESVRENGAISMSAAASVKRRAQHTYTFGVCAVDAAAASAVGLASFNGRAWR